MDLQLHKKTAFITGSTAGIGFATARALAKEGTSIILNGRSEEKLNQAIQRLKEEFPKAVVSGISADFSSQKDVAVICSINFRKLIY